MSPLALPAAAGGARLLGFGSHRPARVVTNDEVCTWIDSSDSWIRERTGIVSRHFAAPDESVADMAVHAAGKALAASGVAPEDVDLVLVATFTHPLSTPGAAAEVATRIGATGAGAVDLSAACAGFCYALSLAADAVRGGSARHVVVVGSEKISDLLDRHDRGTAMIFGDGAGAAVVGAATAADNGVGPVVWGSDGGAAALISQQPSWTEARVEHAAGNPLDWPALRMEGPAVFRWAVTQIAPVARRACELAGVPVQELAAFVPHQANLRIVDSLAKSLRLPESVRVARDIVDTGNTSAASIPLALDRMVEHGAAPAGGPALLIGFGAGLTWAAQVVLIP